MVHEPDGTAAVLHTAIDSVRFTDGLPFAIKLRMLMLTKS